MSNVELARFLCAAMWELANMVIFFQLGNRDKGIAAGERYTDLCKKLDEIERDGQEDEWARPKG